MNQNMSPTYTWDVYMNIWSAWIRQVELIISFYYPNSRQTTMDNLFWRDVTLAANDLEMLDFYGCLDSQLM